MMDMVELSLGQITMQVIQPRAYRALILKRMSMVQDILPTRPRTTYRATIHTDLRKKLCLGQIDG